MKMREGERERESFLLYFLSIGELNYPNIFSNNILLEELSFPIRITPQIPNDKW